MTMNKTMNKLLRYLKKDLLLIVLTILLSFVVSILMIYIPKLFGDAIDLIIEKDNGDTVYETCVSRIDFHV